MAYRELPEYTAPEYDEEEVSNLTQKRAATGLRALRQALASSTAQASSGDAVKRMTLRDALQGYGTGLSSVMDTASKSATSEYGQKYGYALSNAKKAYEAAAAAASEYNKYENEKAQRRHETDLTKYKTEAESEMQKEKYGYESDLLEKKYELEDQYDDWEEKLEKEYKLKSKYDNWEEKLEKEYDIWKDKYDYTNTEKWEPPRMGRSGGDGNQSTSSTRSGSMSGNRRMR